MSVSLLGGISEIADLYDHFILDVYGVLHDGIAPYPMTYDALARMKDAGKQTCLLSNSPRRAGMMVRSLEAMGLSRSLYDHVWTSGEATYAALKERPAEWGDACWFVGTTYGAEITHGHGLQMARGPQEASFILNSIPGTEGAERERLVRDLRIAAERGLPMICANPDLVVNIGEEQHECAGTFAAIYEGMGGEVIYFGKPHAPVYETCYAMMGNPDKARMCAVGDSLHTDIAGANGFGIAGVLNLAGIHREEIEENGQIDEDRLGRLIARAPNRPAYALAGLRW